MRHFTTALAGAAMLTLAACGGQGDDSLGDHVEDAAENQSEALEAQADNATGAQEDALEANAEAVEETGEAQSEAIDDADVKVNQQ